jgi:hypothetical protein
MPLSSRLFRLVAPAALLLAAGCTQSFRADVSRFQQMPAPQGQSFFIQPGDPRMQGGLEFATYARLVADRLAQQGYAPAETAGAATLIVNLDYGVDNGHEKVVTRPGIGYGGFGYGGFGGGFGYGRFGGPWGYGGFGRRGFYGSGWYGGWADPFWYQPFGYPEVDSYTYYVSHLDMRINRAADGRALFEGRARARSTSNSLTTLVPNLVEAMFTGFPGRSGEDVLITVPPPGKAKPAPVNG